MKYIDRIHLSDLIPPIVSRILAKAGLIQRTGDSENIFIHPSLRSYSQYQEDLIVDAILGSPKKGVYVDVGASDHIVFSNTKRFYDRGWWGVNIEPNADLYGKLLCHRPRDINLNIGLGRNSGRSRFYELSHDTLSTFNQAAVLIAEKTYNAKILDSYEVQMETLNWVMENHLVNLPISFLSVDVEGYEIEVLSGNDWVQFRPLVLLVEINQNQDTLIEYIHDIGYQMLYMNYTNGIFIDQNAVDSVDEQ